MTEKVQTRVLRTIPTAKVKPNPENPRLVFRQEEMESLMFSIDRHGIQVPITVYQEGEEFVLLDGERRWRCARKLNLKTVPALIQEKPSELENLVLMYNIHALREQWDYFTIASKLERVRDLYERENPDRATEIVLSELTGLTRGAIRRCQLLIDLPERFKKMLRDELEKPKSQQKLSEDFFIEMERALKTVTNRLPVFEGRIEEMRDALIAKFQQGVIKAVTDFRQLSKIATAVDGLGVAEKSAREALSKVFDRSNDTSIKDAYQIAVEFEYIERRASQSARSLMAFFETIESGDRNDELDGDLVDELQRLHELLGRILGLD